MRPSQHHAPALLAAAVIAFALERVWPSAALWMLLGMGMSIGLLHGAADVFLLPSLSRHSPFLLRLALAGYALVTALLCAALWWQPGPALALLLLLSVWHFGEPLPWGPHGRALRGSDAQALLIRVVRGAAPIAAPFLLSPADLQQVLRNAAGLDSAQFQWAWQTWLALSGMGLLAGSVALGLWFLHRRSQTAQLGAMRRWALQDWLLCLGLNALLSPASAFAIYFGLHHAWPHLRRVWRAHAADRQAPMFWAWAGAALGVLALFGLQHQNSGTVLSPSLLQAMIVALAALTSAHAVVVHLWWHRPAPLEAQ